MRILVVSDSHGDRMALYRAIDREKEAEVVVFLGDGCEEAVDAKSVYSASRHFVIVKGNCDWGSTMPASEVFTVAGKRIFASHGYAQEVKFGLNRLYYAAKENDADIALFGHTHTPLLEYEDGMCMFNPGSVRSLDYGVVDITDFGIVCVHKKLPF